jgi:predicted GNAT family N-acyltransferase
MSSEPIEVREAQPDEVVDLRHAVLRAGFPREAAIYAIDAQAGTHHFAAVTRDGRVVGCVTLVPRGHHDDFGDSVQLRGMAVEERLRGAGVGRRLLAKVDEHVRQLPPPTPLLWCNARVAAIPFYERCGWTIISEVFEVPGIGPHVKMTRRV